MSRAILFCLLCLLSSALSAVEEEKIRFNRDVRPILSDNCFFCHGPDEKKRSADLRLDDRAIATREHEGVRAIVPGKPSESELLKRISSDDNSELMPPPKSKKPPLTREQVAILKKWIEQGAEYEGHWAFLSLNKNEPPAGGVKRWARNPIDNFVLAGLEKNGIKPAPEADKYTLIRRASLDITGLLPSPEGVRAFVADDSPDAYEKVVERLLDSPHFGERWGRHWLDQARYADSNGYTIDSDRAMWPYRDWVIKALNDDMPFDQFTIEQLAGDLLPNSTKSQLIATAFHRNTLINEEGGVDREQFRNEAVVDRVNTTGAVWLGLTVGCAQCHSHKFDPISQREYYQLFAFFNQSSDVNNKGETLVVARGELFGTKPINAPPEPEPVVASKNQEEWEKQELAKLAAKPETAKWSAAKYVEYDTGNGAGFQLLPDNSLLADGRATPNDTYRVLAKTELKHVTAVRLRVLTHDKLPKKGPGTASNGNFVLTGFTASVDSADQPFSHATADHEQSKFEVAGAIDENSKTGWAINTAKGDNAKMNADHEAVFVFAKPVNLDGQAIDIRMRHELNEGYLIGRFALDFTQSAAPDVQSAPEGFAAALKNAATERTPAEVKLVREAFARTNGTPASKKPANQNQGELMVMKEGAAPRATYIHIRGDFLRNDEKTGALLPGGLSVVVPALPPAAGRTRMDLAKWLVNPENPLTPRVTANRMWMHYFGRGLVETDEDFGMQGTPPSNPELLDWLARTLIERKWSMKALHKLIVTSATYRQSSKVRPELAERDPRNLLLARQERVRVEGEIVRDAALSASGLLDETIGGPSVRPPQPEGVYAFTQNKKNWIVDTGANRFRRALYTRFYRSAPYPLLTTFDAPDFQSVCTRRARSNTPLQALTVANDIAFLEIAQGFAARLLREAPGEKLEARLRLAFMLGVSREPSATELDILRKYHDKQLSEFSKDPAAAKALLSPSLAALKLDPALAAATVCVARAIFNLDNFITRE